MEGAKSKYLHRFLKKSLINGFVTGFRVRTSDLLMVLTMVGSVAVSRGEKKKNTKALFYLRKTLGLQTVIAGKIAGEHIAVGRQTVCGF